MKKQNYDIISKTDINGIILLDGPMGTEIDRRGGDTTLPLWSARSLMKNPSLIENIHIDYLKAGADIITTNTFRSKDYNLDMTDAGKIGRKLTFLAVELALNARDKINPQAKIAGSIAPLQDCYSPNLVPENDILQIDHNKMVQWLFQSGVDFFLIETMNLMREIEIATYACFKFDLPIWLSVTLDDNGNILSGEHLSELIDIYKSKVAAILVNCSTIEATKTAMKTLSHTSNLVYGCYPNFGVVDDVIGWKSAPIATNYLKEVEHWIEGGATIMGTCCGATPTDTRNLRIYLDSLKI